MCSEYTVKTNSKEIQDELAAEIANSSPVKEWNSHIALTRSGPIVRSNEDGQLIIDESDFCWDSIRGKFQLPNTRLDKEQYGRYFLPIDSNEWKESIAKRRCLAVVSTFFEPIYTGEYAGNHVQFGRADGKLMFVAGIYKQYTNKKTGEIKLQHSLITDYAQKDVRKVGHPRTIVALENAKAKKWPLLKIDDPKDPIRFLLKNKMAADLVYETNRPQGKDWEKRKADKIEGIEEERQLEKKFENERAKLIS